MIIGSFQAFYNIAKTKPELYNIVGLRGLLEHVDVVKTELRGKPCGSCAASRINMTPHTAAYEQAFEALTEADATELKKLLKTDRIDYYVKDPITKLTKAKRK
jgi:phosphoglycerate dehydrogenase-like enzyme